MKKKKNRKWFVSFEVLQTRENICQTTKRKHDSRKKTQCVKITNNLKLFVTVCCFEILLFHIISFIFFIPVSINH